MHGRIAALGVVGLGLTLVLPLVPVRADQTIIQTPTQTQSIDLTQTNWGPTTASLLGKDPFTIAQFDPTKIAVPAGQVAQLYEVVVSLKYEFINTIQMSFNQPSVGTVIAQGIMHLDVNNASGSLAIQDIVNTPTFYSLKSLSYPDQLTTTNYIDVPKVVTGTSAIGYFDTSTLSTFTGGGVITAPVTAMASSSYTNSAGNGAGGSDTFASAALSVTYYYQIVPEPSSFVLTGLGVAGLCVVARARNRRKGLAAA